MSGSEATRFSLFLPARVDGTPLLGLVTGKLFVSSASGAVEDRITLRPDSRVIVRCFVVCASNVARRSLGVGPRKLLFDFSKEGGGMAFKSSNARSNTLALLFEKSRSSSDRSSNACSSKYACFDARSLSGIANSFSEVIDVGYWQGEMSSLDKSIEPIERCWCDYSRWFNDPG